MNIYLIQQSVRNDWEMYDAAVVVAPDEETARQMHPDGHSRDWERMNDTWVPVECVIVKRLGVAEREYAPRVVLASYRSQ